MKYQIYYYDKSGRRYEGHNRICSECGKKEIIRASNKSRRCQMCARPTPYSEIDYFDSNGKKYPGRIKICKTCGKTEIKRVSNKSEYCKKCICQTRKLTIKENELFVKRSGSKERARLERCSDCGMERLVRNSSEYKTNLCVHCRGKKIFHELGKKYGGWNYSTGIGSYREKGLNKLNPICECCSDKKLGSIIVHHIDQNRNNNHISNLMVLCRSCHFAIHYRLRNGMDHDKAFDTVKRKKKLYPGLWGHRHIPKDK